MSFSYTATSFLISRISSLPPSLLQKEDIDLLFEFSRFTNKGTDLLLKIVHSFWDLLLPPSSAASSPTTYPVALATVPGPFSSDESEPASSVSPPLPATCSSVPFAGEREKSPLKKEIFDMVLEKLTDIAVSWYLRDERMNLIEKALTSIMQHRGLLISLRMFNKLLSTYPEKLIGFSSSYQPTRAEILSQLSSKWNLQTLLLENLRAVKESKRKRKERERKKKEITRKKEEEIIKFDELSIKTSDAKEKMKEDEASKEMESGVRTELKEDDRPVLEKEQFTKREDGGGNEPWNVPEGSGRDYIPIIGEIVRTIQGISKMDWKSEVVRSVWEELVSSSVTGTERVFVLRWVRELCEDDKSPEFLDLESFLIEQILHSKTLPDSFDYQDWECFKAVFLAVNRRQGLLETLTTKETGGGDYNEDRQGAITMVFALQRPEEMVGGENLWRIGLKCRKEEVAGMAGELLTEIYLSLRYWGRERVKEIRKEFIGRCFEFIEENRGKSILVLNALRILGVFMDESEIFGIGNVRPHGGRIKADMMGLTISNDTVIVGPCYIKTYDIKLSPNSSVFKLRLEVARILSMDWESFKLTRANLSKEIPEKLNGYSLSELKLRNGERLLAKRKPLSSRPEAELLCLYKRKTTQLRKEEEKKPDREDGKEEEETQIEGPFKEARSQEESKKKKEEEEEEGWKKEEEREEESRLNIRLEWILERWFEANSHQGWMNKDEFVVFANGCLSKSKGLNFQLNFYIFGL